ncbi:MAG: phage terminase large subunit [Clostridia bacterium]|nr:phage terminase large subunit [Clostridia bacterium]
MRAKLVLLALRYPGIQILLLRRSFPELRENHINPLRRWLYGIATFRESTKEFVFPTGSRIKLGYLAEESDTLQYQGQAYEVIGMEEATQFTENQYYAMTECCRLSGVLREKFTPRMYFTCNPGGVGHAWVKRLFIDRDYRDGERAEDYVFIPSTVYDNRYLLKENPEYVRNLESLPPLRRKAMLEGDWDAFEGQYFTEFDRAKHVIEPFEIPSSWHRFAALDYGLDMTCCLWFAYPPDRSRMVVYRELYEENLILSVAAEKISALTGE